MDELAALDVEPQPVDVAAGVRALGRTVAVVFRPALRIRCESRGFAGAVPAGSAASDALAASASARSMRPVSTLRVSSRSRSSRLMLPTCTASTQPRAVRLLARSCAASSGLRSSASRMWATRRRVHRRAHGLLAPRGGEEQDPIDRDRARDQRDPPRTGSSSPTAR